MSGAVHGQAYIRDDIHPVRKNIFLSWVKMDSYMLGGGGLVVGGISIKGREGGLPHVIHVVLFY